MVTKSTIKIAMLLYRFQKELTVRPVLTTPESFMP